MSEISKKYLIGIDEAGRGPLAGPLVISAFIIEDSVLNDFLAQNIFEKLKDSKKLSEKKRKEWFEKIKDWKNNGQVDFQVSSVSNKTIDNEGMSQAIKIGLKEILKNYEPKFDQVEILLDGALKAPEIFVNQKTIIKGDEKEQVIALASIISKVTRDDYICEIASLPAYKIYQFEKHKGYGTKIHRELIAKNGMSDIHRISFCGNIIFEN